MDRRQAAVAELEVEIGSDPLRGRLAVAGQAARAFTGWLELAQAVEALRAGEAPDSDVPERGSTRMGRSSR